VARLLRRGEKAKKKKLKPGKVPFITIENRSYQHYPQKKKGYLWIM